MTAGSSNRASATATIEVYRQPRFSKPCKFCQKPITMCVLVSTGSYKPFEADPDPLWRGLAPGSRRIIEWLDALDVHHCTGRPGTLPLSADGAS